MYKLLNFILRFAASFILGTIAGGITLVILYPFAVAERGYPALGGEWALAFDVFFFITCSIFIGWDRIGIFFKNIAARRLNSKDIERSKRK